MRKILTICTLMISSFIYAQAPNIEWQKSLGGTGNDNARAVLQTTDGGYIVAGWAENSFDGGVTDNHGRSDFWIVKLNNLGNIEWQKSLGGSGEDYATAIDQTTDGGYIVAGTSASFDGDGSVTQRLNDYWVVKLSSTGNIEWQKNFGGSNSDEASAIHQTTDGGYIVAGSSQSSDGDITSSHGVFVNDYWVVKLTSTGSIEWEKSLGGSGEDYASAIEQTTDGGYIVAGRSSSVDGDVTGNHGEGDYWIVKLNSTGNIEWQKSLGGSDYDYAFSIKQTTDGAYIVAGSSSSNDGDVSGSHGRDECWIVKLNSTGSIIWQKSLGGSNSETSYAIQQTTDGGYVIAGESYSNDGDVTGNHGSNDYWVVKLNSTGNIEWQKSLGGSSDDAAYAIQQTTDGGYIVAGFSLSNDGDVDGNHRIADYWVVKLESSALPISLLSFDGVKNNSIIQLSWQTTNEINTSHFIVMHSVNGLNFNSTARVEARNTSGNNNYFLTDARPIDGVNFYRLQMIDIDGKTTYSPIIKIVFAGTNELKVFPNPAKNSITLSGLQDKGTIKIIAADGRVVKQLSAKAGGMMVDISLLANGIYTLQYNNNETITEQIKIIKQ
ncbi:MAG: T9SS type A sorting domain-containing protein [Ginsengibacter sp.]